MRLSVQPVLSQEWRRDPPHGRPVIEARAQRRRRRLSSSPTPASRAAADPGDHPAPRRRSRAALAAHRGGACREGLPPPFWAFAWAGGRRWRAICSTMPILVAGGACSTSRSGSGLVAIAAMKAGAAEVTRRRHRPLRLRRHRGSTRRSTASASTVSRTMYLRTVSRPRPAEVDPGRRPVLRARPRRGGCWLARWPRAAGREVLIGDPGRSYLPKERLVMAADYAVPVTRELEDAEIKRTRVWRRRAASEVSGITA